MKLRSLLVVASLLVLAVPAVSSAGEAEVLFPPVATGCVGAPVAPPASDVLVLDGAPEPLFLSCFSECFAFFKACRTACGGDENCLADCSDQLEACRCGGCNYCP